jgi:hypothetical protein
MINNMVEKNTTQSFLKKYKKWFVALIGFQVIPLILLVCAVIGSIAYSYVNNGFSHSYKPYIISGFKEGHSDGATYHVFGKKAPITLWWKYKCDTGRLKDKVLLEKKEYLSQFPESERGAKLAEMKLNNIKLPLQLELDKRFTSGLAFYTDHVKQRVKREGLATDAEYQEVLQDEAWKVGYAHGYNEGLNGTWYNSARDSLR